MTIMKSLCQSQSKQKFAMIVLPRYFGCYFQLGLQSQRQFNTYIRFTYTLNLMVTVLVVPLCSAILPVSPILCYMFHKCLCRYSVHRQLISMFCLSKDAQHHERCLTLKVLNFGKFTSYCSSYLADPTSPIPSHCASIVVTSTLRV